MIDEEGRLLKLIERQEDMLGNTSERAYTATLRVSPDGSGADGLSWRTAYQTPTAALDAASTDTNDLTLILIAPHPTYYDMDAAGIPEWAANVVLRGTHRGFAEIRNTNGTQSAIMRLTGHSVVDNLRFYSQDSASPCNGLIMEGKGARVYRCEFDNSALATAIGVSLMMNDTDRCKVLDCDFWGNTTYGYALQVSSMSNGLFQKLRIHDAVAGIRILNVTSDRNIFSYIDIGECAIGIDIDAGNEQFFHEIVFHHNTRNVDDEVGDHVWVNIYGLFPIYILPDNFAGITVNTGAANVYGGDTELIALNAIDNPFRVVGTHFEPSANEWYKVRFTGTAGVPYHDALQFDGTKREGGAASAGTEFIFNADTRLSCSAKSESGGNSTKVWVEIQEI